MKQQIAQARALRDEATGAREASDLAEALSKIGDAAKVLDELWKQHGAMIDDAGADASPDEKDLVEDLAETYGVMGGIHRSDGDFKAAIEAYEKGIYYEQHAARKVDNSYNLVQRLLNCVLLMPALAGSLEWVVLEVRMDVELEHAKSVLAEQTRTTRSTDPWAAADVILIETLLVPLHPGSERAASACAKLDALNPKPFVYESTLRTFRDAQRTLYTVEAPVRHRGLDALTAALDAAISRLDEGFRQARVRHATA